MHQTLIIAEAGVNHNGSLELAVKMIDAAKNAGADFIKFQTVKPENLVSKYAEKAKYQKKTTNANETQLEMLKKIMLPFEDFIVLKKYCEKIGIGFLTTPFDMESIHYVEKLIDIWKIPSGEITNLPYLVEIARNGKPIILSTGMSTLAEVESAIRIIKDNGTRDITLLHCNTQYPTPYTDVNLLAMRTLAEKTNLPIGYSDHTKGIDVPIAAVALGARVIEKHFTLDRDMEGPDHKASLEPDELKKMVESIRNIELALGNGIKIPSKSEIENIAVARKSIVAKRKIIAGEIFTEENITTKRPGTGISPMNWNEVIGRKAIREFMEDELIEI